MLVNAKKVQFIDNPIYIKRIHECLITTTKKHLQIFMVFVSYMEILKLLKNKEVKAIVRTNKQIKTSLESILYVIWNNAIKCFSNLTNEEVEIGINNMNEYEKIVFKTLFLEK